MGPVVRDYPWSSLDRLRRADLAALRGLFASLRASIEPRAALAALETQSRSRIDARFRRTLDGMPEVNAADVGVLLTPSDAAETSRATLILVEGGLAATLVARALEQPVPRLPSPHFAPAPAVCGAFAALLVRAARREATTPLRVLASGPAAGFARDLSAAAGSFVGASFTLVVDDDAYLAHVLVARAHALETSRPPWSVAALARCGALPLEMPIVVTATSLAAADVAALREGDVLVVPEWPLRKDGTGPVRLAAPSSEQAVTAELESPTRLVLRGEMSALPWSATPEGDTPMTDPHPLAEAVGEVPVVLRVELGTAQLSARAWSELGPGDVLTVGRRVKEPVSLRVSGVEVARGELVDVDGEVGVRILSVSREAAR